MDLTDEQWAVVEPLIGEMPRRADGRGWPWRSSRTFSGRVIDSTVIPGQIKHFVAG